MTDRPPIVTDVDRAWAMSQRPAWVPAEAEDGEVSWAAVVDDNAANFERYFAFDRKTHADWSRLWRKSWWPKVDARKLFPKLAPKQPLLPFFRDGSPEFERAMALGTERERIVWKKVGVVQFKSDDPRLKRVMGGPTSPPVSRKMAAAGDIS